MDNLIVQITAWIASAVLGITAIGKIWEKFSPKIRKGLKITDEVLDVLVTMSDVMEDKKITKEEVEAVIKEVMELKEALK